MAGPLGVADELYFGMPEAEHHRLARLEDAPGAEEMISSMPQDFPMFKSATPAAFPTAELGNRTDILAADIPAGARPPRGPSHECTPRCWRRLTASA